MVSFVVIPSFLINPVLFGEERWYCNEAYKDGRRSIAFEEDDRDGTGNEQNGVELVPQCFGIE